MLSACIIAKNEEENIANAIENLQGFVDEIIVMDNQSTDKTAEIVRKYKEVRLFFSDIKNDFGALRNSIAEVAKGDWLFMADADELCSEKMRQSLKKITEGDYDGVSFLCKNYCDEKLVQTSRKLSLFRNYGRYKNAVHESVDGLKKIVFVGDEDIYTDHRKPKEEQRKHLELYKRIIDDNIILAKKDNNLEKLAYYEEELRRHHIKEQMWLNRYIEI